MRKLKLQMQVSVDGFVAGPQGEMDWMVWNWDESLKKHVSALTEQVDCIVLGRVLAEGFIPSWEETAAKPETSDTFARKVTQMEKVVFTRTLPESRWKNTRLAKGPLLEEMQRLKAAQGGEIMAYGGGGFVSELSRHGLIDEYHLFVNPSALGSGMSLFRAGASPLKLLGATAFECGIVGLRYAPART